MMDFTTDHSRNAKRKPIHNVAVVGAGISGLAVASLLKQQGHEVTIFERFSTPRPVGSGLILHRPGLATLAHLGLEKEAIDTGSKLTRFEGKTIAGKIVFDLSHDPDHFSLGIHRDSIFSLLYGKVLALTIQVISNCAVDRVDVAGDKVAIVSTNERRHGGFDLVVDASGARSSIRDQHARVQHRRAFAYGALWGVCEARGNMPTNVLRQRFDGAKTGLGLIPIGRKAGAADTRHIGFHWSIRNSDYEKWRSTPLDQWKREVTRLWNETDFLVDQITEHDDLTWAAYADVALEVMYSGRIVFIGDAAHSISPRLGQGANLGLMDALVLSKVLRAHSNIEQALHVYDKARRDHVRFYHSASRWLSVLFQSDSVIGPALRDLGFGPLCRVPYMRRQMLESLEGVKTGLFKRLEQGDLRIGGG